MSAPADVIRQAKALLELDAEGALVPHGIGGLGRTTIERLITALEGVPIGLVAVRDTEGRDTGELRVQITDSIVDNVLAAFRRERDTANDRTALFRALRAAFSS